MKHYLPILTITLVALFSGCASLSQEDRELLNATRSSAAAAEKAAQRAETAAASARDAANRAEVAAAKAEEMSKKTAKIFNQSLRK
jgi:hypothetical protein